MCSKIDFFKIDWSISSSTDDTPLTAKSKTNFVIKSGVVGGLSLKWKSEFWRPNPFQIPNLQSSLSLDRQHKQIYKIPLSRSIKKQQLKKSKINIKIQLSVSAKNKKNQN